MLRQKKFYILLILVVLFLAVSTYGFGWEGFLASFGWVVIYSVGAALILSIALTVSRALVSILVKEMRSNFFLLSVRQFRSLILIMAYVLTILPLLAIGFIVVVNTFFPGKVSRYEVSNGEKTIVYQSMSHLASQSFYDDVRADLTQKGEEGFVLFYEGVRPGSVENERAFGEALGFDIDMQFYENFRALTGLVFQGDVNFLGLAQQDFNVDLSIDDIMRLYDDQGYQPVSTPFAADFSQDMKEITQQLQGLTPRQKKSVQYVYRAFFNVMLHLVDQGQLELPVDQIQIFNVILDDRNDFVAKTIDESEYDKIYLMYGALHFSGVYDEIRRLQPDRDWTLVSIDHQQVVD